MFFTVIFFIMNNTNLNNLNHLKISTQLTYYIAKDMVLMLFLYKLYNFTIPISNTKMKK